LVTKKTRKIIAAITVVVFMVVTIIVAIIVSGAFQDLTKAPEPKPRTATIPLAVSLDQTPSLQSASDVNCSLIFNFPNGTLYTNNNITIPSQVALSQRAINALQSIEIGFQNSLQYPLTLDVNNMPISGILHFGNFGASGERGLNITDSHGNHIVIGEIIGVQNSVVFEDTRSIFWSLDGDYKAIIHLIYKNGTTSTLLSDSTVMHVYPEEELTQVITSQAAVNLAVVSITVSIVALFIGAISVFSLAIQIIDGGNDNCNYPKYGTPKPKTGTEKDEPEGKRGIKKK
jgi:hypothetical protein